MKNVSDVVDIEVVKNKNSKTLETKLNEFENKILDATTLIHINQYNTDKKTLEKQKIGDVHKKYHVLVG